MKIGEAKKRWCGLSNAPQNIDPDRYGVGGLDEYQGGSSAYAIFGAKIFQRGGKRYMSWLLLGRHQSTAYARPQTLKKERFHYDIGAKGVQRRGANIWDIVVYLSWSLLAMGFMSLSIIIILAYIVGEWEKKW